MELLVDEKIKRKIKIFAYYVKLVKKSSIVSTTADVYEGEGRVDNMNHWYSMDHHVYFDGINNINQTFEELFENNDLWDILFENVYEDINYSRLKIYINVDEQKVWFDAEYESYGSDDSSSEGEISESWMERLEGRGVYTARYSGGGDDGSIHDDVEFDGDGDYNESEYKNYAYHILEDEYGGWQIDDGSEGKIIINTIEGTWEIEHSWYDTRMVDAGNPDVYFYF